MPVTSDEVVRYVKMKTITSIVDSISVHKQNNDI